MTEIRIGQVWKDRLRSPVSVFLVHRVWTKAYPDGSERERATGVLVCGTDADGLQLDRDLDCDSLRKMFPHLMFNPPVAPSDPDDDK